MNNRGDRGFNLGNISRYRSEIFGLSIIWIMLLHGVIMDKVVVWDSVNWLYVILEHGNVGVDIFLFLSGIGLYFSFTKDQDMEHYMKKRFTRILLPYALIGGISFFYIDMIMKYSLMAFIKDFSLMTFVFKGNKIIWYIFIILFCYIIFPYVYSLFYQKDGQYKQTVARNFILFVGLVIFFTFILQNEYPESYSHLEIAVTRIPVFICGCLAARVVKIGKKVSNVWLVLAFVVVITAYPILNGILPEGIYQRYYYCILGISLVIVFAFLFSIIKNKIVHKVFCWFGEISLELYITHILMRHMLMKSKWYTEPVLAKYACVLGLTILLAKYVSILTKGLLKKPLDANGMETGHKIEQTEKKKMPWIDQSWAIAFYFVILGNLPIVLQPYQIFGGNPKALNIWIYAFHMPLIFFLGGVALKKERIVQLGLKTYAKALVTKLLVPYFWLNFLLLPVWVLTGKVLSHKSASVGTIFAGIFWGNPNIQKMPQGSLWILLTLFLALLVYAVIVKGCEGKYKKMIWGMFIMFALGYFTRGIDVPWHINGIPAAVIFIFLGNVFFDLYRQGKLRKLFGINFLGIVVALLTLGLGFYIAMKNGKISMIANDYGNGKIGYGCFFVAACLLIWFLLYIVEKVPYIKWLSYLGQNVILYIGLYVPIRNLFQICFPDLMKQTGFLFAFSIFLYFIMIPCSLLMNKFFPYVCGQHYRESRCTDIGKPIAVCVAWMVPVYLILKKYHAVDFRELSGMLIYAAVVIITGVLLTMLLNRACPVVFGKPRKNER